MNSFPQSDRSQTYGYLMNTDYFTLVKANVSEVKICVNISMCRVGLEPNVTKIMYDVF